MNTLVWIVSLRASALALALAGQQKASDAVNLTADAIEAGQATDAHLQLVADKLKDGTATDADWDDVAARITADRDRLHGD